MANPIENWLYKGATNPRSYYANLPLWDALKMDTGEGWSSKYTGPGKSSWPKYMYEGIKSLTPWGSDVGNISGGTSGSRALYERFMKGLPYLKKGAKFFNRLPVAGFASDALFGTTYTADTAKDINNLLGINTSSNVNQNNANQNNANQGNNYAAGESASPTGPGQTGGFAGSGLTSAPPPRGPDLRNRARGGIISLWQR